MPMDNVTLENTQQSISSRDAKSVASVMVNGKWVNLSDTLEQANVKSDVGTVAKQVAAQQEVLSNAASTADSAVAYANDAIEKSKVNSQAIMAQSEAISEAKSAIDSATAEIQQAVANANSDAANIRADVAQVQNEVDTAEAANSANVEALKSDVSAAKQDIQAAQQANENVAKQLDTYTEQAQAQGKTIKDIQDAQDGYTATIADIKGNVSKISDTVDGLSASLKDDQTDVVTLKAQADQLSATLTDHDKSIAQLTASAKELSSTLEDADGRLSKVEQTASTLTNEFSDQQGQLNRVEQTATGTQQTVANQQGQINSIQTDVSGIHETIIGQGKQVADINVTLTGLNSKYEGVSDDLEKLKDQNDWKIVTGAFDANQYTNTARIFYQDTNAKKTPNVGWFYLIVEAPSTSRITQTLIKDNTTDTWTRVYNGSWQAWTKGATNLDITALSGQITTNTTQITQNKQAIALKADQSTVDSLSGEVSQNTAQLKVQADQISSKVSSSDFKTLNDKVNGAISSIQNNSTAIDQTNKQISLKADQTEVDQVKNTATQNSSRLDVMDGKINSKVTSTDVNNIVNSKGYATASTVQSLITQTAGTINESITNLDAKYSAKDGVNLQRGTGDCSFPISSYNATVTIENYDDHTKMFHVKGTNGFYTSYNAGTSFVPTVGETYTVSADVKGGGTTSGDFFKYEGADSCSLGTVTLTDTWQRISNTVHIGSVRGQWIFYLNNNAGDFYVKHIKIERCSVATPWTPAPSDNATVTQVQSLTASIDGLQSNVTNLKNDTSSQITQLSTAVQSKVSQGDYNSQITQLQNDINLRVSKGDVISQINQEAGGDTLIQVSNGKKSLILDAGNTIITGKAWIPSAAIANLTADDITTGTLKGVDIDFRNSSGQGVLIKDSTVTFDDGASGDKAGYLSFSNMPIADWPSGTGGNELQIKYGESLAIVATGDTNSRALFSTANTQIGYHQPGDTSANWGLTGLKIDNSARQINLGVYGSDGKWARLLANPGNVDLNASDAHCSLNGGRLHFYKDNDNSSPIAVELQVDGWAWVRGWVEAAGHSQHSALSTKTDIQPVDDDKMLKMVNDTDLTTFLYKTDVASGETHRHIGLIIDDVHDVAQYQTPQDFIAPNRVSRDDDNMIGALFGAVKALTKRIKILESKVG